MSTCGQEDVAGAHCTSGMFGKLPWLLLLPPYHVPSSRVQTGVRNIGTAAAVTGFTPRRHRISRSAAWNPILLPG